MTNIKIFKTVMVLYHHLTKLTNKRKNNYKKSILFQIIMEKHLLLNAKIILIIKKMEV